MSALPNRYEFLPPHSPVEAFDEQAEQAREEQQKPEPLWLSVALTLGVGIVVVALVLARAWLG